MRSILRRIGSLECDEALVGPPSIMNRLEWALDQAAFRLTGRSWEALANDPDRQGAVCKDVSDEFITRLKLAELETLTKALEARLGNDPAAIAIATREASQGMETA